ncbi:MAG: MAE_28990/MAE_18760 family HEPN-like nuclease [Bacteroidota bacterium]
MKVRTKSELQNKLDQDIQWRKKELIDYMLIVKKNIDSTSLTPLVRGGIALGYAHWEGFIKKASSIYMNYISIKKIPLCNMRINFIALSYLKKLNKGNNIDECISIIQDVLNNSDKPCKIYDKEIIDTKSNLRFYVLKDILTSLGFDHSYFASKENFIDKKLVNPRNDIAHGTYIDVNYEDFLTVHHNIIPLMEHYKTLIENSAELKSYKKT